MLERLHDLHLRLTTRPTELNLTQIDIFVARKVEVLAQAVKGSGFEWLQMRATPHGYEVPTRC